MSAHPSVAILPWGDVFEDWLDRLGVPLDAFVDSFTGSWMFAYAEALRAAGVQTVLVCFTSRVREPRREVHRATGAVVWLVPPPRAFAAVRAAGGPLARHGAPYLATAPRALARVVRAERCSALLCQEYETPRFDVAIAVGARLRLPVFATFQGGDYQVSRLERLVRPFTIRRAAALVVATADERARVRARYRIPAARLAAVFNPIDVRRWRPVPRAAARAATGLPADAEVVAWHGQVQLHRKGLDLLLDAWDAICRERPHRDLRLVLVGAGEDAAEVRALVAADGLRGVELREGWVDDRDRLRDLLAAADVYAFASRHEGLPLAPAEAMACGLPVVASAAQGIRDLLADGDAGVVVPREDAGALARALGRLLDDGAARTELGLRARSRAESAFSLEAVGDQLRRLLVSGGGP